VTNDLERRLFEHKNHILAGFSDKYNVNRLVYYEEYQYITDAIAREKEIKGWVRKKKVALIEGENPTWADLAADWGLDGDV
jgi:putative endonuclease